MTEKLEKQMLKLIANSYPYPLNDVEKLYKRVKSFDKTIKEIEYSMKNNVSLSPFSEFDKLRDDFHGK
jgi:hypothetical protein